MSAGAIGIEERCFVNSNRQNNNSNSNNNDDENSNENIIDSKNNAFDYMNNDINHILRNVNVYKKARKRNWRNLYDKEEYVNYINNVELINKKKKCDMVMSLPLMKEEKGNESLSKKDEDLDDEEEEEDDDDMHIISSDDSNENSSGKSVNTSSIGNFKENEKRKNEGSFNCYDVSTNEEQMMKEKINLYKQKILEDNEKKVTKQMDICVENILDSIKYCNEIEQVKKIMRVALKNFIQKNFIYVEALDENNTHILKTQFVTLHKEKSILKSAVKWQYQMITHSQKDIDNLKLELKKKNEELNQMKAKLHQYFYELSNPTKEVLQPYMYPDVH